MDKQSVYHPNTSQYKVGTASEDNRQGNIEGNIEGNIQDNKMKTASGLQCHAKESLVFFDFANESQVRGRSASMSALTAPRRALTALIIEKPMVLFDFARESLVRSQVSVHVSLDSVKESLDNVDY